MPLLLAPVSPAGPVPAASPCPPREKGGSGCLIFPGRASSQTTSPCCPTGRGVSSTPSSQGQWTPATHTSPLLGRSPPRVWSEEATGWDPNAEVPSPFHRRHVKAPSTVGLVLPTGERGWPPAGPGEGRDRPALPRFTPLLCTWGLPWVGGSAPPQPPPSHQHLATPS